MFVCVSLCVALLVDLLVFVYLYLSVMVTIKYGMVVLVVNSRDWQRNLWFSTAKIIKT